MITVLMGAPGAGKTTWLKNNGSKSAHIASTEAIRINRDIDRGLYMMDMRLKAVKAAESGKDLIVDGTNTITTHRQIWLNLARRLDTTARLIVFDTPLAYCIQAQYQRQYPAPITVVKQHHARMSVAKRLILDEGWDEVLVVERI